MNESRSNVIAFPKRPSRDMAMRWLVEHHVGFPDLTEFVYGPAQYGGWRFFLTDDKGTVFCDFISRCITEDDYFEQLRKLSRDISEAIGE